jgi:iron-sulfur cluster repair protein YtfE (RIC family)
MEAKSVVAANHLELPQVQQQVFAALAEELGVHLMKEEQVFPFPRAVAMEPKR